MIGLEMKTPEVGRGCSLHHHGIVGVARIDAADGGAVGTAGLCAQPQTKVSKDSGQWNKSLATLKREHQEATLRDASPPKVPQQKENGLGVGAPKPLTVRRKVARLAGFDPLVRRERASLAIV
jgi:hypothetical protein